LETFGKRLVHAWNAFQARDETDSYVYKDLGLFNSTQNPTRVRMSPGNERSILTTITNRIALDVASFDIIHARVDENGQYLETINDPLNQCLRVEANKDQTGRVFIQDVVMSMFDEGSVAIVPVETSINPTLTGSYDIFSLRTGKIVDWYPNFVRVEVYNDRTGRKERILMPKNLVGIIENPLYAIMNEPNSTLKRLIRKLNLLDGVDEAASSGKLDLIIQLPYTVTSEARQLQAEGRIKSIERQLKGSKYGVAYTGSTEHITQLNRPVENNLLTQIQYLTQQFYNQLGFTEAIFNGKATEAELRNYYDRSIEPIVTAIVEELLRKFLTKTARSQGQKIMGFRDVFRLIPANEIANIADVFSRNEILTPNELRQIVGRKPSDAPHANELQNRNMPSSKAPKYNNGFYNNKTGGNNNGQEQQEEV
jgi:ribosomal protein L21E